MKDPFTGSPEEFENMMPQVANQPPAILQAVEVERAVAEVQASMAIAKRFPRNEQDAYNRIMRSCSRLKMAEQAEYAYKRGNTVITGPSVQLARVVAQNWGNIQFGIRELERGDGYSVMESFAWDLETNAKASRTFTQKHRRKARGSYTELDDDRDIYELTANNGARRERACILEVVPSDVVDDAVERCRKTLKEKREPIGDRIRKMVALFDEYGVTTEMIEGRLGHKMDAIKEPELSMLGKVYTGIRDGMSSVGQEFGNPISTTVNSKTAEPTQSDDMAEDEDDTPTDDKLLKMARKEFKELCEVVKATVPAGYTKWTQEKLEGAIKDMLRVKNQMEQQQEEPPIPYPPAEPGGNQEPFIWTPDADQEKRIVDLLGRLKKDISYGGFVKAVNFYADAAGMGEAKLNGYINTLLSATEIEQNGYIEAILEAQ